MSPTVRPAPAPVDAANPRPPPSRGRRYLRTPEWRRTRAAALDRAGHQCAFDPTHTKDLHVHHRTYERRGGERPGDLLVVCRDCHDLHHAHHGRPSAKVRRAARRKARLEAELRLLVFRACVVAGLLIGLLGMLGR